MKTMKKIARKVVKSSFVSWCIRKEIRSRLTRGFDINGQKDGRDQSVPLLHFAILARSYETCKFLLENGAQVNIEYELRKGEKYRHILPIHDAIEMDCPKILKLLIEFGANLDGLNEDCSDSEQHAIPLDIALISNMPHIVKILIDNGAEYSKIFYWSVANNIRNEFEMLFENGANVNVPENVHGDTLLHVALKSNKRPKEIVKTLVQHGAHLNVKDRVGNTPMETALQYRDVEMVKICLLKDY